jgi:hypothetical protein
MLVGSLNLAVRIPRGPVEDRNDIARSAIDVGVFGVRNGRRFRAADHIAISHTCMPDSSSVTIATSRMCSVLIAARYALTGSRDVGGVDHEIRPIGNLRMSSRLRPIT